MSDTLTIRATTRDDLTTLDALYARSYPSLLKADYPPSNLVTAIPIIAHVQPKLVASGTFFGVFDGEGAAIGAGGWTRGRPGEGGPSERGVGHIRHVVTDHRRTRQGIGRALMEHIFDTARAAGVRVLRCQSTLTAEPFYGSLGFKTHGDIVVPLRPGIDFPAKAMVRVL